MARKKESDHLPSLIVLGSDDPLAEVTVIFPRAAPSPLPRRRVLRLRIVAAILACAGAVLAVLHFLSRSPRVPRARPIPPPVVIQPIQPPVVEPIPVKYVGNGRSGHDR